MSPVKGRPWPRPTRRSVKPARTSRSWRCCPPRPPKPYRDAASRNGTVFACVNPGCGWVGHADTNAAINIDNADGSAVSGRGDLGVTRSVKRQPPRAA
ncbi:zinc ribbon domain-containing protein [Streptosporangium sp. CA-115845]|uniref:zinc ribbon domain-containing protein n=1 Tax=Streptosporangium sp. CA-115845 TaxID=3240071 RepID=UPI003D8DBCD8